MTNEEKVKLYEPKRYALYINGNFHSSYSSHAAAKKAQYFKKKDSYNNLDDDEFEIKPLQYNK